MNLDQKLETDRQLFSAADLQRVFGLSRSRAYEMLNRADLPVIKIGRRRLMHAKLFSEWLEQQAKSGSR